MINGEGSVFVGLDLSSAQAGAEEDTGSIRRNGANDLELCR